MSRCDSFITGNADECEQSLLHYQIFQEYCEYFETIIEDFLTNNGISAVDFYQEIRNQLESCKRLKDRQSTFGSLVLSSVDFHNFCIMMNDVKEGRGFCFVPPLVEIESEEKRASIETADEKASDLPYSYRDRSLNDEKPYSHK